MSKQLAVYTKPISIEEFPEATRLQIRALQMRHPQCEIEGVKSLIPVEAAIALYQEEKITGLSVAAREIGWTPEFGVYHSSKTKAFAAMQYASSHGDELIPQYTLIHPKADAERFAAIAKTYKPNLTEADIVVECKIVSPKRRQQYWQLRHSATQTFALEGMKGAELRAAVVAAIGGEPTEATGLGIVRSDEKFGGSEGGKTLTRVERAEKRAFQRAINSGGLSAPVNTIDRAVIKSAPAPENTDIDYSQPEPPSFTAAQAPADQPHPDQPIEGQIVTEPEPEPEPAKLPDNVQNIIDGIRKAAQDFDAKGYALSEKQAAILPMMFGKGICKGNADHAAALKMALFGVASLKDASAGQLKAVWQWIAPEKDPVKGYLNPSAACIAQAAQIIKATA